MKIKDAIRQLNIETKARLLTGGDFWTSAECGEIGLGSFSMSDGPNGLRYQSKGENHLGLGNSAPATCLPSLSTLSCSFDENLLEEAGKMLANEASHFGVSVLLGPGLNIKRSPLCGRNFEYFSEDPYLSGKLAAAYARGVESGGVTACLKHFAVNGRELGRMVYDVRTDDKTLREIYLTAFEIAVKEGGAGAVMSAYNKLNGVYCNGNEYLIRGILRGEWGFDGLVVSDWGGGRSGVAAVKAGADLEMPKCAFTEKDVVSAVKNGELDEKEVDACVERIYRQYEKSTRLNRAETDFEKHSEFAEKCAEESIVLLENKNGALPLDKGEKVAFIGDYAKIPRYQGAGSSRVNPYLLKTFTNAAEFGGLNYLGYESGFKRFGGKSEKLAKSALKLAKRADTVVFFAGLDENREAEGTDRENILLPENQTALLERLKALGKKIVLVVSCGGVVDLSCADCADGVIYAGLCGQSGADALIKILTGEINPSGRLSESFIYRLGDAPCAEIFSDSPEKIDLAEGVFVGYRFYTAMNIPVRYPFGYGLSYTKFKYGGFSASADGVRVTVKNTGAVEGATVLQVYIKSPDIFEKTPSELKAFKKVKLAPNEEREVFLPFDEYAFRKRNAEKNAWQVGGEYEIMLGENCADVIFSAKLKIDETNYALPAGYIFADGECGGKLTYKEYFDGNLTPAVPTREGKRKLICDENTLVTDLRYCKGVTAKVFAFIVRRLMKSKDKTVAASVSHLPVRTLMQFAKFDKVQAEGFIEACNGKFFKGLRKLVFGR